MYNFYTILFFLFTSLIYGQYNIEHSVYFETSLFSLSKTEEIRLQKFIDSLPKKDVTKIQIYGFCDDRGAEEYNLGLSQNRANEIKKLFKKETALYNKILNVEAAMSVPVKTVTTMAVCFGRRLPIVSRALPTLLPNRSPNAAIKPPKTRIDSTKI